MESRIKFAQRQIVMGSEVANIKVVFYQEEDGSVPLLDWLDTLSNKIVDKCRIKIERLKEYGYELSQPEADYLRDGLYELRVGFQGKKYRMLYFFHGKIAIVLSLVFPKGRKIPDLEIEKALLRKKKYERHPGRHTYKEL